MKTESVSFVVAWLLVPIAISEGGTLTITPTDDLSTVREKLAADVSISEVVLSEGVYRGGLTIEGPRGTDFTQHPLLIRAADGAHVVFDGVKRVERAKPHEALPGVFWIDYTNAGGEYPKFWEPGTRIRYRLVADGRTVARYPATYSIDASHEGLGRQVCVIDTSHVLNHPPSHRESER